MFEFLERVNKFFDNMKEVDKKVIETDVRVTPLFGDLNLHFHFNLVLPKGEKKDA